MNSENRRFPVPVVAALGSLLLIAGCRPSNVPEPPDPIKMRAADQELQARDRKMMETAKVKAAKR